MRVVSVVGQYQLGACVCVCVIPGRAYNRAGALLCWARVVPVVNTVDGDIISLGSLAKLAHSLGR